MVLIVNRCGNDFLEYSGWFDFLQQFPLGKLIPKFLPQKLFIYEYESYTTLRPKGYQIYENSLTCCTCSLILPSNKIFAPLNYYPYLARYSEVFPKRGSPFIHKRENSLQQMTADPEPTKVLASRFQLL